jgi:mitochondrial fission protein ELM1
MRAAAGSGSSGLPQSKPHVWVLAGEKPGDNAQLLSLASALGWPFEVKQLRFRAARSRFVTLAGREQFPLNKAETSPLAAPWPDLVLGCGQRSVAVALRIRRQAGGSTRLVWLGRPRVDLDRFDLVVTTPQYRVPEHRNVLHLALPLHSVDRDAWDRAAAEWAGRFAALPRPWVAVLVGGSAVPFVFDIPTARRLAGQANALARAEGGSLLVSTSRRTPPDAARAFSDALAVPAYVHHWTPGGGPNPYLAYLALADAFIATGDSASMLTEACSTGKRVWIADLPERRTLRSQAKNVLRHSVLAAAPGLTKRGWIRNPRDLHRLHAELIAANRALPLGRPFTAPPPPPADEIGLAVARVRALFER